MHTSLKTLVTCALLSAAAAQYVQAQTREPYSGKDPEGVVAYSLPSTSINMEVEAVQEIFHAGPYAKFAGKYLGIDVQQKDASTCNISKVRMSYYVEPDNSRRFLINTGGKSAEAPFLKMTNCGLIATSDGSFGAEESWKFPSTSKSGFSEMGLTSNLTYETTTLYRNVKNESAYNKVAVQQNMVVEKSIEKRAAETAELIFSLRKKKLDIITGYTDATYSGEAMGAAIAEISRLEKEYLTMFTGYTEYREQKSSFDVIPVKNRENQLYVAFRISDTAGLLPAENISGKPVILEIIPQEITETATDQKDVRRSKAEFATYRIPAICNVRLTDGVNVLLQGRFPIYQLGEESTLPVNILTK